MKPDRATRGARGGLHPQPGGARVRPGAFTVIELVVSAALMSMILASGYLCLRSALAGQQVIESETESLQKARVAMALMSADLRAACPLSPDLEFLGVDRMLEDVEADNLDFATHNFAPRRLHEADVCEVSYYVQKERDSDSFSLWRRRDATLDAKPLDGGSRELIAEAVRGVRFEYYDGFEWYHTWGDLEGKVAATTRLDRWNLYGMPEAVRITLWLDHNQGTVGRTPRDTPAAEPPRMFQTIARLNLAGAPSDDSADANDGGGPATGTLPTTGGAM